MEKSVNEKQLLRDIFIAARKELSSEKRAELSEIICNKLLSLPEVQQASSILSYKVMGAEVDLSIFNTAQENQGKIIFPAAEIKDTIAQKFDIAIVPGVAFDLQGYRLGRGGGYYDKLLSQFNCKAIGVCFDFQLVENLPRESHDVKMAKIVTDKRVVEF